MSIQVTISPRPSGFPEIALPFGWLFRIGDAVGILIWLLSRTTSSPTGHSLPGLRSAAAPLFPPACPADRQHRYVFTLRQACLSATPRLDR